MKSQDHTDSLKEHNLHGWDDGKLYYWTEKEGEVCVSDIPELMDQLEIMCKTFLENKKDKKVVD